MNLFLISCMNFDLKQNFPCFCHIFKSPFFTFIKGSRNFFYGRVYLVVMCICRINRSSQKYNGSSSMPNNWDIDKYDMKGCWTPVPYTIMLFVSITSQLRLNFCFMSVYSHFIRYANIWWFPELFEFPCHLNVHTTTSFIKDTSI